MTDARGVQVSYSYDALNRVIVTDYPGSDEDRTFSYDHCNQGVGRLCTINDQSGQQNYAYDAYGNRTAQSRTQDAVTYLTEYRFDAANRITSMTYPNGRVVTYQRDSIGRISRVDSSIGSTVQTVVHSRSYRADGLLSAQTYGNGLNETRDYDTQGRLTQQVIGSHETRSYHYDANGNVIAIPKPIKPTEYEYDRLNRLIGESSVVAGLGNDSPTHPLTTWTYDANGNRIHKSTGSHLNVAADCDPDLDEDCTVVCTPGDWCFEDGHKNKAYTYIPQSNQLTHVGNKAIVKDAAGNTLSDKNGKRSFAYNNTGRLFQFYKNGSLKAEYTYNSQNQRVKKVLHKLDTDGAAFVHTFLYFYDQQGQLISEYKNGKPIRDYLWADNQPLQRDRIKHKNNGDTIVKNSLSLVTDHLHTPRIALDDTNTIVWRWDSNAFGKGGIDKDPDGDGSKHNIRLRFPGQYADPESGLYYNWNRYYDDQLGRYITSDPIGLDGGVNTFGYVMQNPGRYVDPTGELICGGVCTVGGAIAVGVRAAPAVVRMSRPVLTLLNLTDTDTPEQCEGDDDNCGNLSRAAALRMAQAIAKIPKKNRESIPFTNINDESRKANCAELQRQGATHAGYKCSWNTDHRIEDHPDGHPHQIGPGFPDDHKCPHFHVYDKNGTTVAKIIYRRS